MSYLDLDLSLLSDLKANVRAIWTRIKSNFEDHETRLQTLDTGSNIVAAGTILWYGFSSVPANWLACDGSAVSRTTYSALFTAIGTAYGVGDGATTFNLPDYRGRAPMGAGAGSSLTARSVGDSVGAETVGLDETQIPSHNHSVTDPGHTHTWPSVGEDAGGGGSSRRIVSGSGGTTDIQTSSVVVGEVTVFVNNRGAGTPHNNVQPSLCVGCIIKT